MEAVRETDVVVVGAGNAAICAAFAAQDTGASVIVLERAPQSECGGNSAFTGGATRFAFENTAFTTMMYEPEHHNWRMLCFDGTSHWNAD